MKKMLIIIQVMMWCFVAMAQPRASLFQAIVAADGSGDYTTVQSAIDAMPEGRTEPWIILVKNGQYNEQVIVPESKPYVHLIGQDADKTIIHLAINVGGKPSSQEASYWTWSMHNPEGKVFSKANAVFNIKGNHFYAENISFINDWGVYAQNGPQALAMNSSGDCAAFNNCRFRSFQDTWMTTTNDKNRHYVYHCYIEGAVDYFYGGGDVLVENSTFYNVRSGSVIVAPCHKDAKYGYAFRNCLIDGNTEAADGKQKLGRPWHNRPIAVYINSVMRIPLAPEGWTDMGTVPGLFAEYGSRDMDGNLLDLSQRKTTYKFRGSSQTGTCRSSITKEEADTYTYENMIPGKDGWNPRAIMKQLPAPKQLVRSKGQLSWQPVEGAKAYVVFDGEEILGTTNDTSFPVEQISYRLMVAPVNRHGALGKKGKL